MKAKHFIAIAFLTMLSMAALQNRAGNKSVTSGTPIEPNCEEPIDRVCYMKNDFVYYGTGKIPPQDNALSR